MYVYAGIDEAGYGPMFGPLLVGRTVLGVPHLSCDSPPDELADWTGKKLWRKLQRAVCRDLTKRRGRIAVNDSKKLFGAGKNSVRNARAKVAAVVCGAEDEAADVPGDVDAVASAESVSFDDSDATDGLASAEPSASASAEDSHDPSELASFDGSHLKALAHLERGALAFAALAGRRVATVCDWLDCLGENCHHDLADLPWYAPAPQRPWGALPCACTEGEIAVARSLLRSTAEKAGVRVLDVGAAVVFEDRFNRMVGATRSKAATSFTFVAGHLRAVWDAHGAHGPRVVVDRQSGRMRYRELLALTFPEADLQILDESPESSAYRLTESAGAHHAASHAPSGAATADTPRPRSMTVSFEVDSEDRHMPVALASMISKYTRELLMARFQTYFHAHAPHVKPTAGYAKDGQRFWQEIQPLLPALAIDASRFVRCS